MYTRRQPIAALEALLIYRAVLWGGGAPSVAGQLTDKARCRWIPAGGFIEEDCTPEYSVDGTGPTCAAGATGLWFRCCGPLLFCPRAKLSGRSGGSERAFGGTPAG